ncbi:MAG: thiamine pyrophosphate-binding protein, partial [Deltaproteobacteria bacterium]|nr:thiamine pyrophosphate-binding protein [Deltaproteobacteria bacterium]
MTAALRPAHEATAEGLSPYHLALRLRAWLPRDTMLTTDVGSHKLLFGQVWPTHEPLTFFMSNGLSSMGYGFPAALAAKLLLPDRPVVAVCGDGGFMMSLHDLETAVRLRLAVVTLVLSDHSLALIRLVQEKRGFPPCGVDFQETDFAVAARAMGAAGVQARTFGEVEAAVRAGLAARGPTV